MYILLTIYLTVATVVGVKIYIENSMMLDRFLFAVMAGVIWPIYFVCLYEGEGK